MSHSYKKIDQYPKPSESPKLPQDSKRLSSKHRHHVEDDDELDDLEKEEAED